MHCRKGGSRRVRSTMSPSGPHQSPADGIGGPFYSVPLLSVCLQLQAKQGPTPAPPRWLTEISALSQAWYRVSQMPLQRHNWHLFSLSSPLQPPPFANSLSANNNIGVGGPDSRCLCLKKKRKEKKRRKNLQTPSWKKTTISVQTKRLFPFLKKKKRILFAKVLWLNVQRRRGGNM